MSFYKAAGAVLLLFGGVSLGRALCQKIEAGFAQTEGFIALLKYIRNQIDCYLMPVDKILAGCDPGILETCGVSADADLSVIHSFSELLDCCELCISEVLQSCSGYLQASWVQAIGTRSLKSAIIT